MIAMFACLRSRISDRHARAEADAQSGYSIIELLVAMGIFAVVLSIATAGMLGMTKSMRKVANTNDAARQLDRSMKLLGRQVPFAQDISWPSQTGSDWYVSYDITDVNGTLQCYQWRLVAATDLLQYTTWPATSSVTKTWVTMSTGVINDPTTQQPFTLTPAAGTNSVNHEELAVDLFSSRGGNPPGKSEVQAVLVGANSDVNSSTNVCP